ncbi:protein-tyrosine sulfotransferase 1-like [Babylonia areolata]|uniref:protein-tyrosine sulfotransferase 1-like n=1 Tax=Babylonia areolata TaxID=304850 RepID=UPI003FD0BA37
MDMIFIGGMPRSGTTLMRVMLDAHPHVRCGEETRIIPRILSLRSHMEASPLEKRRLDAAGVTSEVLDSAVRAFLLEVIAKHGEAAPRLCNKDPFTLKSALYLSRQFPRAKFLLMVRDGRAVVHSIISRRVTIMGFDLGSYRKCLQKWNAAMETMHAQCLKVGPARCLHVYYEQLVLHPREWMSKILSFLDLPWNDTVLHHEDFIGNQISLSSREKSTDQVMKPVNVEALSRWVGHLPDDVTAHMDTLAPMLATLGYDPRANPPHYGQPDAQVARNTRHLRQHADFWRRRVDDLFDKLGGRPVEYWVKQEEEEEEAARDTGTVKQEEQEEARETGTVKQEEEGAARDTDTDMTGNTGQTFCQQQVTTPHWACHYTRPTWHRKRHHTTLGLPLHMAHVPQKASPHHTGLATTWPTCHRKRHHTTLGLHYTWPTCHRKRHHTTLGLPLHMAHVAQKASPHHTVLATTYHRKRHYSTRGLPLYGPRGTESVTTPHWACHYTRPTWHRKRHHATLGLPLHTAHVPQKASSHHTGLATTHGPRGTESVTKPPEHHSTSSGGEEHSG